MCKSIPLDSQGRHTRLTQLGVALPFSYARDPEKMPAATYEAILARLGRFEAEFTDTNDEDAKLAKAISKMANESFEIPHDP